MRQAHGAARLLKRAFVAHAAGHRGTGPEVMTRPGARTSRSLTAVVLAIALGLGLAACGGGGTGTADTAGVPTFTVPTTPPAVAATTTVTSSSSTSTSGTDTSSSGATSPSSGATSPSSGRQPTSTSMCRTAARPNSAAGAVWSGASCSA